MVAAALVVTREGARLPQPRFGKMAAFGHVKKAHGAKKAHKAGKRAKKRHKHWHRRHQHYHYYHGHKHFAHHAHHRRHVPLAEKLAARRLRRSGAGEDALGFGAVPGPALRAAAVAGPKALTCSVRKTVPAMLLGAPAAPVSAADLPVPAFGLPVSPKSLASPPSAKPPLPLVQPPLALPKPQFGQAPPVMAVGAGACAVAPKFTPDNELIFQIDTQRHEMSDTIVGYHYRGTTFLPLGEMARFLDLAVTVSDDGHYASGWVIDPHRRGDAQARKL